MRIHGMGNLHETGELALGRASFERRAWTDAFTRLTAADSETPLEPEDLERAASAAQLVGRFDESADLRRAPTESFSTVAMRSALPDVPSGSA